MKKIKEIVFILLLLCSSSSIAQKLKGQIKDSVTNETLPYATLAAMDQAGKIITGTLANEEGKFELMITQKVVQLNVSHLGYKTTSLYAPFTSDKSLIITLATDENILEEVVIEGDRTSREFLIDRKVINFGYDLQSSGGTVLEALDQLPEIETDPISNDIRLRGSGNVRILIDGQPSPLNNTDLLAQIDASQVERVEIITAPSAKYQADGQSGIINIVLKNKVVKGLAGTINMDGRTNPGFGTGINLTGGFGNFNIQSGISYRDVYFLNETTNFREFNSGVTQDISAEREFDGSVTNLNFKVEWFLDASNDLSISFRWTNNEHFIIPVTTIIQDKGQTTINVLENYHQHRSQVYNANYRKRFDPKKNRTLDIDINLNNNDNLLPSTARVNEVIVLDNDILFNNYIFNGAIDLAWEIDEKSSIEAGGLYTRKFIENEQFGMNTEGSITLTYNYDEDTYALYFLYKKQWNKLGLQLGLRSEYFQSEGNVNNEVLAIAREFLNLFPSFHLNYKRSELLNYSLSVNRRIARPSFFDLNPLTTINNPLFRREGNPALTPEFTDNLEFGLRWNKKSFSLNNSLFYRRSTDLINRLFVVDSVGSTVMTFSNGGNIHTIGIESTLSKKLSEKLDFTITATGFYQYARPDITDFFYANQYNYNLRTKLSYKPSQKLSGDIQWNYFGERRNLNLTAEDFNFLNIAVRYKTLQNKGTFTLRFTDAFRTNIFRSERISNSIKEDMTWKGQTRVLILAFNYRFSKGDIAFRKSKSKNYNESGALE